MRSKYLATLLMMEVVGTAAFAQPVEYPEPVQYIGSYYGSNAIMDVDGDQSPDVLVALETANNLVVLRSNGAGSPIREVVPYPSPALFPVATLPTDLDADGDMDAVVVCNTGHVLRAENFGSGLVATIMLTTGGTLIDGKLGDVNGDGRDDLILSQTADSTIRIHLADGLGGFSSAQVLSFGWTPGRLAVGDINGDGSSDLLVSVPAQGVLRVLNGNGSGSFVVSQSLPYATSYADIELADLDGDGDLDCVGGARAESTVRILANSNGSFGEAASITLHTGSRSDVRAADADGDGDLDLYVAFDTARRVEILRNDGSGGFMLGHGFATTYQTSWLGVADFDGHAGQDIAMLAQNSWDAELVFNAGDGSYKVRPAYVTSAGTTSLAAADFDSDGDIDVVSVGASRDFIGLLENQGDGTVAAMVQVAAINNPRIIKAVDVDSDGDQDMVVVSGTNFSVLLNNGEGSFVLQPGSQSVGANASKLTVADIDADGHNDLIFTFPNSVLIRVAMSNGDGTFEPYVALPNAAPIRQIECADINGDGLPELLTRIEFAYQIHHNVNGIIQAPVSYPASDEGVLLAGDFDGNEAVDLVLSTQGGVISIAMNDGTGNHSTTLSSQTAALGWVQPHACVDVDSDGDLDIVARTIFDSFQSHSGLCVLLNDGTGQFTHLGTYRAESMAGGLAVADMNGDGLSDLLCGRNARDGIAVSLAAHGECPSDFDGSGFVDTDDFTAFVVAFEAGGDAADFDSTGFVDTDDFDAFVRAFESGC
ncbi:MAG TPA: VCBS repeat-containing protein [Phycisphaerales bacterium]|nr:VCBS repeat-containing protein [Phycisphaerales bacterium]